MVSVRLFNVVLSRLASAALMWAPLLLWLTWIVPPQDTLRLHALTAGALAVIGAQVLGLYFSLPLARPAPGRYRVLPSSPHRPMLVASVGVASVGWGLWRLLDGPDGVGVAGAFSGGLAFALALRSRADPLWGTWMELAGEVLRVHCPRASDWSVPLTHARAIHIRPQDGSFILLTPWPERDVFIPSARARARYMVTDSQSLLVELARRVPIQESPLLLAALRRRGERDARTS